MTFNPKVALNSGQTQNIDYTPGSAVAAGDVVIINGVAYFAQRDIASGVPGALAFSGGVWKGNKKTGAFTAGDAVYYKTTEDPVTGTAGTGAFTSSSSGATFAGYAVADAASGDQFVYFVKANASTVTATITANTASSITDPGASGAIPVTGSGYVDIVTAGAETRTLAAPTVKGSQLLISFKTKVGNCVITCATTVNTTGNNTITLSAAGQAVLLIAKTSGSTILWSVVSNDGASLSTV
jgi:predicted RecA/RadA family phage recombinase